MTDRELLEAAARAAGYEVASIFPWSDGLHLLPGDGTVGPPWNPLTDDGDALWLAVKLRLPIGYASLDGKTNFVTVTTDDGEEWEPEGDDPLAATRRAIVRAAAEMEQS